MWPFRKKEEKPAIVKCMSPIPEDDCVDFTSFMTIVRTKKEFLKYAARWWDARGTHVDDYECFMAFDKKRKAE